MFILSEGEILEHPALGRSPTLRHPSVAYTLLVPANIRAITRRYRITEKSVAHRLHCAMPVSGNFAIQAESLFQSSLNLDFLFGASRFIPLGSAIAYPENVENSARNYPENAGDCPIGIHNPRLAVRRVFTDRLRKTLRPTFQLPVPNLGAVDGGLGLWLSLEGWDFG